MVVSIWRSMLVLWQSFVLLVISLPWSKFEATPHWKSVQWVPFQYFVFHSTVLFEMALNVVAFIPVGYLTVRSVSHTSSNPIVVGLLVGICSSVSIEFYQLFCHDRVPSTTDVLLNVGGTAIGIWLAFAIDHIIYFFVVQARRLTA